MGKDKLNDACDTAFLANYFPSATESPDPRWELFADGFKQGAEWLMGQPLTERLTEEEKKKIRQLHKDAELFADAESVHKVEMSGAIYLGRLMALDMIFGKEMFEQ